LANNWLNAYSLRDDPITTPLKLEISLARHLEICSEAAAEGRKEAGLKQVTHEGGGSTKGVLEGQGAAEG
jgi:hypothetical protein